MRKLPSLLLLLALAQILPPPAGARAQGTLPPGSPVVLGSDTVLWIHARVGSFSAEERAAAVRRRLRDLIRDPYLRADTVHIRSSAHESDLVVDGRVVMTLGDADAAAAAVPRDSLARAHARQIARVLHEQGFLARARAIGVGLLLALATVAATALLFRLVRRGFGRLAELLEAGRASWMPALRVQSLEILSANQLTDTAIALVNLARVVLLALLLYVSIPIVLLYFPWTRRYADLLFGYVLAPFAAVWNAFVEYVPSLITIVVIVVVVRYLLKLIRLVFLGLERGTIRIGGFYPDWAIPTYNLVRALVLVFALVAAWPYLPGSGSPAFQGVGVFLGLLISLGSASAIGNVVGGVVLTYMRPFRVGDRVKIADTMGDVVEKTLLITRVRTIKNVEVTIPNAMVLGSHLINYSTSASSHGLILNSTVTIGYDVPWRQVHELLLAAAHATPGVLTDPPPFVLQTALNDFYVSYEINAYTDRPNAMASIYSSLHANIQDRFNEAGVEILSPHYRAARDGNASTVPEEYLPPGHRTPAFRVAVQRSARRTGSGSETTDGIR